MFRVLMCYGASNAAGRISRNNIARLLTIGNCMTIQEQQRICWKLDHETNPPNKIIETGKTSADSCGTRAASLRTNCAQNRPRLLHANLHMARWKSRGGKAVNILPKANWKNSVPSFFISRKGRRGLRNWGCDAIPSSPAKRVEASRFFKRE